MLSGELGAGVCFDGKESSPGINRESGGKTAALQS